MRHVTILQAAKLIRRSLVHTYRLVWEGKLKARRANGRWLIPSSAIGQWTRKHGKAR